MAQTQRRGRKLLLIDISALVYRAFFALPPLSTSAGQPIGAAYGFDRMLARGLSMERPSHVAACFDAGIPQERLATVPEYKANRPAMPDELRSQFPVVRMILDVLNVAIVEMEGEEADDCIATLATRASAEALTNVIVSGDLDLLQLVDEHCTVIVTRRGISDLARYDQQAVRERFGLTPAQLPDFRGLKGDPSDNLPGVPGIGEKTAAKLIAEFGSLDELLARVDEVRPPRIAQLLRSHGDQARRCRDVTLAKRDLAVNLSWSDLEYREPDPFRLQELYAELEFRSLVRGVTPGPRSALTPLSTTDARPATELERTKNFAAVAAADEAALVLREAAAQRCVAIAIVPELESWRSSRKRNIAIAWRPGEAVVIAADLLQEPQVESGLRELLESDAPKKIVHNAKNFTGWLRAMDLMPSGIEFDTMLAQALLDPSRGEQQLAAAGFDGPPAVLGLFDGEQPAVPAQAGAADAVLTLAAELRMDVEAAGLSRVLFDIELPLALVLADTERVGFRLDLAGLDAIRCELDAAVARLSGDIFRLAEEEFNINSPRALGTILFEKLKLPSGGKTKTGYSTSVDVLTPLALEHEIAAKILEYREVAKLKSTYADALPQLVDPRTGRLHTTLHQLGAATGRLASSNPNLQNIPIRSEVGRVIRRAFLPPTPGNVLLAADYSQIELRLFAHLADDPNLIAAFEAGEDIHAFTARAVFGMPEGEAVPAEVRRRAKAVNFGILYGMGPRGLAQSAGLSRADAKAFIDAYFERFPRVRDYIARTLTQGRELGYVTTIMGRRRYLPDLNSGNRMLRAAAERMAVNAPLQGSAADLIKLAMVRAARRFAQEQSPARLVLQVHDELIFDVPPDRLDQTKADVRVAMEEAMQLRVPLAVDFKSGPNWAEVE